MTTLPLEAIAAVYAVAPESDSPIARCIRALSLLKNARVELATGPDATLTGVYEWVDGGGVRAQPDLVRVAREVCEALLPLVVGANASAATSDAEGVMHVVEPLSSHNELPDEVWRLYEWLYGVAAMLRGAAVYADPTLARSTTKNVAALAFAALREFLAEVGDEREGPK
jgi:hypothetical protein